MAFPLFLQNLDENLKLIQSLSARSWVWKQTRYMYIWYTCRRYPCERQPVIITCNHFEYYSFGDIAIIFLCQRNIFFQFWDIRIKRHFFFVRKIFFSPFFSVGLLVRYPFLQNCHVFVSLVFYVLHLAPSIFWSVMLMYLQYINNIFKSS